MHDWTIFVKYKQKYYSVCFAKFFETKQAQCTCTHSLTRYVVSYATGRRVQSRPARRLHRKSAGRNVHSGSPLAAREHDGDLATRQI